MAETYDALIALGLAPKLKDILDGHPIADEITGVGNLDILLANFASAPFAAVAGGNPATWSFLWQAAMRRVDAAGTGNVIQPNFGQAWGSYDGTTVTVDPAAAPTNISNVPAAGPNPYVGAPTVIAVGQDVFLRVPGVAAQTWRITLVRQSAILLSR